MTPTPHQIRSARVALGMSQAVAALTLHVARRTYQDWEAGIAKMPGAAWELMQIKLKEKSA